MRISTDITFGDNKLVELVVTNLDIQTGDEYDYSELAWSMWEYYGNAEQIVLYINNLYVIILDKIQDRKYNIGGRYIEKYPLQSDLLWMGTVPSEIPKNQGNSYIKVITPLLQRSIQQLIRARIKRLN